MLSASGGIFMAKANDLIVVFLGLEILSIALYVLAGYHRRRSQSQEAAIKYFVLGSFSSAFFLYGIALTYGATGSTNITEIGRFLQGTTLTTGVLLGGVALLLVGLGFKVAAVPFHMWTPDVYQGSPTPVAGFMAAAAKTAGFAALLRIFYVGFGTLRLDWQPMIWALAVLSLVVGSVLAVVQSDVKRMLAYSSISHAGYVLIGLQAATDQGIAASLFYLLAYTFMILGSFAVVTLVGRRGDGAHALDDYRGLAKDRPGLALAFTAFLLAQAGVPFTAGFLAKFGVIAAAVEARSYAIAIIAMVAAVIAAFLYLRVIVAMYMAGDDGPAATEESGPDGSAADGSAPDDLAAGVAVATAHPHPNPGRHPGGGGGGGRPVPGLHHRRRAPARAGARLRPTRRPAQALGHGQHQRYGRTQTGGGRGTVRGAAGADDPGANGPWSGQGRRRRPHLGALRRHPGGDVHRPRRFLPVRGRLRDHPLPPDDPRVGAPAGPHHRGPRRHRPQVRGRQHADRLPAGGGGAARRASPCTGRPIATTSAGPTTRRCCSASGSATDR